MFRETHGEVLGSENINRTCGFRETHGEVLGSENIHRTCGFRETKCLRYVKWEVKMYKRELNMDKSLTPVSLVQLIMNNR